MVFLIFQLILCCILFFIDLDPIEIQARSIVNLCKKSDAKAKHCRIQTSLASNRLKDQIKNPLYHPSLKTYSKDLLQKNETSKKISIQEPEQGTNYQKIHFYVQLKYFRHTYFILPN
jgi:hypothetical protein